MLILPSCFPLALNGNDIPEQLPPELVPPSARDLNDSVDFLKDLLKRDTNVRNTTGLNLPEAGSNSGASYSKARSFHENPVAPAGPKKDATAYRHQDKDIGGYKSNSRHLDRRAVRFEGQSAADDLSEMKRQLANTQKMLDKQDEKDEDDRELERELDDLRFRIRRVQDDIEYVNRRGGRDSGDERRKLERELLHLMHERLPQLERRMEEKERRQRDRQYDQSRERDRRNESSGKYSERDRRAYSSFDRERDSDRYDSPRDSPRLGDGEYLRGTFERERERDGSRDRYGDRDGRSPPRSRDLDNGRGAAPPPPPPPAEAPKAPAPPPPAPPAAVAPAPAASPAPSSGAPKNMTPEERQAWIRSEAQRRIQERMRALGAAAPASASAVDTSVEERLKADQAEAQARSAKADEEAAERERTRRARLEEQKIKTDKAALSTVKAEMAQAEKGPESERPPAPVIQAAKEEINDEEEMIRRREAVLAKEKAERLARLKRLEEEEEEARRQEAAFKERQSMFSSKAKAPAPAPPPSRKGKGGPPPPPPSRKREDAAPAPPAPPAETPSAPAPPAPAPPAPAPPSAVDAPAPPPPPAPPAVSPSGGSSTNPFHRMQQGSGSASTPAASTPALTPGGTNPFFRMQQEGASEGAPAGSAPQAQRAAAPIAPQPTGRGSTPLPQHGKDEDWEDSDKEEDDDDDGPGSSTRATRANLAQQLFSGLIPGGRATPPATPPSASSPAPPPPPPAPGAPFPPSAPAAPATLAFVPPSAPADRGALLSQISGGLRLKKTQTVDKSKPLVTGAVIGDAAPPVQTYVPPPSPPSAPPAAPPAPEPEPEMPDGFGAPPSAHEEMDAAAASANPNRQSVDWAASLAADQMNGRQEQASRAPEEPSLAEEDEEDSGDDGPEDPDAPVLGKQNGAMSFASADTSADPLNDVDTSVTTRMRSLYAYSGQREEDLSFDENVVVLAHPAKDPANDWWYGVLVKGGAKGWFPKAYVQSMEQGACDSVPFLCLARPAKSPFLPCLQPQLLVHSTTMPGHRPRRRP